MLTSDGFPVKNITLKENGRFEFQPKLPESAEVVKALTPLSSFDHPLGLTLLSLRTLIVQYAVRIVQCPDSQQCEVQNGTGIAFSDVFRVQVTCVGMC
jgi:hypothetical protein